VFAIYQWDIENAAVAHGEPLTQLKDPYFKEEWVKNWDTILTRKLQNVRKAEREKIEADKWRAENEQRREERRIKRMQRHQEAIREAQEKKE
jgi:hypothetical protein